MAESMHTQKHAEERIVQARAAFSRFHKGDRGFLAAPTSEAAHLLFHFLRTGNSQFLGILVTDRSVATEIRIGAIDTMDAIARDGAVQSVRMEAVRQLERLAERRATKDVRLIGHASDLLGPLYRDLSNGLSGDHEELRDYAVAKLAAQIPPLSAPHSV